MANVPPLRITGGSHQSLSQRSDETYFTGLSEVEHEVAIVTERIIGFGIASPSINRGDIPSDRFTPRANTDGKQRDPPNSNASPALSAGSGVTIPPLSLPWASSTSCSTCRSRGLTASEIVSPHSPLSASADTGFRSRQSDGSNSANTSPSEQSQPVRKRSFPLNLPRVLVEGQSVRFASADASTVQCGQRGDWAPSKGGSDSATSAPQSGGDSSTACLRGSFPANSNRSPPSANASGAAASACVGGPFLSFQDEFMSHADTWSLSWREAADRLPTRVIRAPQVPLQRLASARRTPAAAAPSLSGRTAGVASEAAAWTAVSDAVGPNAPDGPERGSLTLQAAASSPSLSSSSSAATSARGPASASLSGRATAAPCASLGLSLRLAKLRLPSEQDLALMSPGRYAGYPMWDGCSTCGSDSVCATPGGAGGFGVAGASAEGESSAGCDMEGSSLFEAQSGLSCYSTGSAAAQSSAGAGAAGSSRDF